MRPELHVPLVPQADLQAHTGHIAQRPVVLTPCLCFAELQEAVVEVLPTLTEQGITVYLLSEAPSTAGLHSLGSKISQASDQPLSRDLRANVHIRSTALYIYTSGTTGNAGRMSTHRCARSRTMSGDNADKVANRAVNSGHCWAPLCASAIADIQSAIASSTFNISTSSLKEISRFIFKNTCM